MTLGPSPQGSLKGHCVQVLEYQVQGRDGWGPLPAEAKGLDDRRLLQPPPLSYGVQATGTTEHGRRGQGKERRQGMPPPLRPTRGGRPSKGLQQTPSN